MPAVEGKVAVVTGASSGIGEAIVKELVGAGVIVAGLARRIDRVEALAATLKGQKGKLSAIKCDVTKEDDVISAFAWVEKNLGPPDFVINNAGVLKQAMISSCDLKDIQVMFDTNVVGIASCSREALKSMVKNKTEGTIININSFAGHFILPFPGIHGYNASKFAVTALTEGLRNEVTGLNANIRVTSLSPGAVESEMTAQFKTEDSSSGALDHFEMLPAKDIADCALFILQAPQRMNSLSPGAVESEITARFKNDDSSSEAVDHFEMLPAKDIADCVLFILQAPQRMNVAEMRVLPTKETVLSLAQVTVNFLKKAAPK